MPPAKKRKGNSKSNPKSHTNVVLPWCEFVAEGSAKANPAMVPAGTGKRLTSWLTSFIPFSDRVVPGVIRGVSGQGLGQPVSQQPPTRLAIIGIHGWFPARMFQKVVGQPTGTSPKFCSQMLKALQDFYKAQYGIELDPEEVLNISLEGEGMVNDRLRNLEDQLLGNNLASDNARSTVAAQEVGSSLGLSNSTNGRDTSTATSPATSADNSPNMKNARQNSLGSSMNGPTKANGSNAAPTRKTTNFHTPATLIYAAHERLERLRSAEVVFIATHSQGTPVSAMFLASLIRRGILDPKRQTICLLAMAGISHGPFPHLKGHFIVKYFEADAARELFEYNDPDSNVALRYYSALDEILAHDVKLVYVSSWLDQVVPLYSSSFHGLQHPNIFRAVHIDKSNYDADDFLVKLVIFAMHVRNHGLNDHDLLIHLSDTVSGSLYSGTQGHSTLYEELDVFKLAVHFALGGWTEKYGPPSIPQTLNPSKRPREPSLVDIDSPQPSPAAQSLTMQKQPAQPELKTNQRINTKISKPDASPQKGGIMGSLISSRQSGLKRVKETGEGDSSDMVNENAAPPTEGAEAAMEADDPMAEPRQLPPKKELEAASSRSSLQWIADRVYIPLWSSSTTATAATNAVSPPAKTSPSTSEVAADEVPDVTVTPSRRDDGDTASVSSMSSVQTTSASIFSTTSANAADRQHTSSIKTAPARLVEELRQSKRLKRMSSAKAMTLTPSEFSATFWVGQSSRVQRFHAPSQMNPYYLPWIMRGIITDEAIRSHPFLSRELESLLDSFRNWNVEGSKQRKELKYRLQVLERIQHGSRL